MVAALTALAVVLTPIGSAGTTSKPFAANFGSTVAPAAAGHPTIGSAGDGAVTLAITDQTRNQGLGSANVYAPAGVTITGTDAAASNLDATQTFPATTLKLRNLNLNPPTTSATYGTTIYVSAPCGSFTWNIDAHQSNDYNSSTGNSLYLAGGNLNTLDAGSCHLAWLNQPASANVNTTITDTPFTSTGTKVTVAVEDASNAPIELNTGTATLAVNGTFDDGSCTPKFTNTTSTTFQHGIATFASFQSGCSGTGFTATASALGLTSPASSPPFVIEPSGVNCIGKDPCHISGPAGNGQVGIDANGGNFIYMAFSSSQLPSSVTGSGGGCANFTGTHTDFAETDARSGDGTLVVTLSLKNNDLKQAYGPNYGQPNVPICVGVKHLVGNTAYPCTDQVNGGTAWNDRLVDPATHTFTTGYGHAVCDNTGDAGNGYWWGVAGTFQDPVALFDPTQVPLVTGWGGSGTSPSSTRTFTLRVPAQWDMQGHG